MKPLIFASLFSLSMLRAQNVPPRPKPADNGPTLEVTMKYLEEKLSSIGPVTYIIYIHDNTNGHDWTNKRTTEVTDVRASVALCEITFHRRITVNGNVAQDTDGRLPLKDVVDVAVETEERNVKEANSKAGHPELSTRVDPPVFVLTAKRKGGGNDFDLYDESPANRIGKAMVRGMELCGGSNKGPVK
jgi:hypothetical protein